MHSEIWCRALGPDGDVLEEGPVKNGEAGTEWKELVRQRYRVRPITLEIRTDGEWRRLREIRA